MLHSAGGDPAAVKLGDAWRSRESIAALRHEMGLDRPLAVQYLDFLSGAVRGDFGRSYRSECAGRGRSLLALPGHDRAGAGLDPDRRRDRPDRGTIGRHQARLALRLRQHLRRADRRLGPDLLAGADPDHRLRRLAAMAADLGPGQSPPRRRSVRPLPDRLSRCSTATGSSSRTRVKHIILPALTLGGLAGRDHRPHDPRLLDRGDGPGLRPHGPRQGARGAGRWCVAMPSATP